MNAKGSFSEAAQCDLGCQVENEILAALSESTFNEQLSRIPGLKGFVKI